MPGRFSLRLAIALVLAPAVCLCILAYEGALGANPVPFNDEPSFNDRRVTQNEPFVFCTYMDQHGQIQAEAGHCTSEHRNEHNFTLPGDFGIERTPHKRATPPGNPDTVYQAQNPKAWKGTARCRKDFCEFASSPNAEAEILDLCYQGKPLGPDPVFRINAPLECNLCLEDGKLYQDWEGIQRHCIESVKREALVLKILAGVLGGVALLAILGGIYWERKRKINPLKNPYPKAEATKGRFGGRHHRVPVLPPYDGASSISGFSRSLTASQRDALELSATKLTRSVASRRRSSNNGPEITVTQPVAPEGERDVEQGQI